MNVYYFANQVYQFSNALPIFREIGGTLIIHKLKKLLQTKQYLRGLNIPGNRRTFLNTPPILWRDLKELTDLRGIIISLSTTSINCDHSKCKMIFIGHGSGDKKYGADGKILEGYDFHFLSGPKHLEKLKDLQISIPEARLIKIGNMRFDDYLNQKIDRNKECERLGIVDRDRKNVLYAPTWRWGGGTFKTYIHQFAQVITQKYNLIVRPHHHDRRYIPRIRLWAKFHGIKHIYFSNPANIKKCDTMHDFVVSDIMISDTSSILYEYLITRQPIIAIRTDFKDLHRMPDEMNIMKYTTVYDGSQNILELIDENLKNQNYKDDYEKLLHNCFYFNDGKSAERALTFIKSIS
ncbi:MAG TPA: CDP-glycerol glycerophosphotransferase family protein [bacterium]